MTDRHFRERIGSGEERVNELQEFLIPSQLQRNSEGEVPLGRGYHSPHRMYQPSDIHRLHGEGPYASPRREHSFTSNSGSYLRGDIGGTTSMKMSKPELNEIIQKASQDVREQGRVYRRQSINTPTGGSLHNRMASLSAKGWRPGSPQFPSDDESSTEPKRVAFAPSRIKHSQSMAIGRDLKIGNIREKSESNHSEESNNHALNRTQRLRYQREEQKSYISKSEFIARNHIFLNTFFQFFIVGTQLFVFFYGNWACRSISTFPEKSFPPTVQDVCYTLFQFKTYQEQKMSPTYISTTQDVLISSESISFPACISASNYPIEVVDSCKSYMWAGIGFAIIDSLGLLLCIYAIICSFGIVMIWRVPFKNNLKKFLIIGYSLNSLALLYWMIFAWADFKVSISPDPIVVFVALAGALMIIIHFNHWINNLRKTRLIQMLLQSGEEIKS